MDILIWLLSAVVGWTIGYIIFYWRFADREIVSELRKHNLELKHQITEIDRDRMEFEQQNIIFRDEITWLYQKNDDLTKVVSELSRYYYHLKKISHKMTDLARDLQQPLENLDREMKPFLYGNDDPRHDEIIHTLDEEYKESWFF